MSFVPAQSGVVVHAFQSGPARVSYTFLQHFPVTFNPYLESQWPPNCELLDVNDELLYGTVFCHFGLLSVPGS